jgi:hypothetical protein
MRIEYNDFLDRMTGYPSSVIVYDLQDLGRGRPGATDLDYVAFCESRIVKQVLDDAVILVSGYALDDLEIRLAGKGFSHAQRHVPQRRIEERLEWSLVRSLWGNVHENGYNPEFLPSLGFGNQTRHLPFSQDFIQNR